jgi:hypothetical protein
MMMLQSTIDGQDSAHLWRSPQPQLHTKRACVTGARELNVRSGPGAGREILRKLAQGDCVHILPASCQKSGDSAMWCYAFAKGWANMAYLYEPMPPQQLQSSTDNW